MSPQLNVLSELDFISQGRIQRGQITLKDGGARLQARISALRAQIAAAEAPQPAATSALLGSAHRFGSPDSNALVMVPVENGADQPGAHRPSNAVRESGDSAHRGRVRENDRARGDIGDRSRKDSSGAWESEKRRSRSRGRSASQGRSPSKGRSPSRKRVGGGDKRRGWHLAHGNADTRGRSATWFSAYSYVAMICGAIHIRLQASSFM